jgi:hypothetical protein
MFSGFKKSNTSTHLLQSWLEENVPKISSHLNSSMDVCSNSIVSPTGLSCIRSKQNISTPTCKTSETEKHSRQKQRGTISQYRSRFRCRSGWPDRSFAVVLESTDVSFIQLSLLAISAVEQKNSN